MKLVKSTFIYLLGKSIPGVVVVLDYECVASPFILGDLTTFIKNFSPREANQKTQSGESSKNVAVLTTKCPQPLSKLNLMKLERKFVKL